MSLVRFKTGLEGKPMVESMTVFNSNEVDTKKQPQPYVCMIITIITMDHMTIGLKLKLYLLTELLTKLNEYQKMIITSGLVSWARELKVEIANMEAEGKTPLFTRDFVDMQLAETLDAVASLTRKRK